MLKQVRVFLLGLILCSFGCSTVSAYSVQGGQVALQDTGNYYTIKNAEAALQQIGAILAGGVGQVYTFTKSLVSASGNVVSLVNDSASPGNNQVYSTDSSGVKGWNSAQSVVTSGNLLGGTGLSVSGGSSAVLGSGATVSIASGFYLPLTTDQTKWNQAFTNMLTSSSSPTFAGLTLTGLSGVLKASAGVVAGSAILNDLGVPTSSFSMNSQNLINVLNPSNPQDAATKSYVDALSQGLQPKVIAQEATAAVLAANTYNNGSSGVGATLTGNSNGALTVDGVAVALNDRVLVQNEVAGANNGIYTETTLGDGSHAYVLTRATDNNTSALIRQSYIYIVKGTANAGSSFVNTNTSTITVGTTAITWIQFSVPITLSFNSPLSLSGGVVSILQSNSLTNGYLSSSDWSTFNNKQGSLGNINGIVKGNGSGTYSAAVAETDYTTPTGTGTLANKTLTNTNVATLLDNSFTLQNNGDTSKQVTFALSGITTGNARVLTIPDASITLVGTSNTQTLTGKTYDTAGSGNILKINGTQVSAVTGSGSVVLSTSPSLVTPSFTSISNTGLLTLPTSTDTLVGRNTTDTFTNKTLDTAAAGNVFKINGTAIAAVSGSTSKLATTSGTLTSGNCVKWDASGNAVDAGAACGTGGGSGSVTSGTAGQPTWYAATGTIVSGFAPITYSTTFNSSSGTDNPFNLSFTTTESSAAGFTGIKENVIETTTGTGPHLLMDLQVGGASQFNVTDLGVATAGSYKTNSILAGEMDLYAPSSSFYVYLKSPASLSATVGWTLPTADSSGCFQSNGSGVITIGVCGSGSGTVNSGTSGDLTYYGATGTTVSGIADILYSSTRNASSGIASVLSITPTWTQTATAGYNALFINSTETTTGSGNKYLIDAQTGGVDEWHVTDTGNEVVNGTITASGAGASSVAGNFGVGSTNPQSSLTVKKNGSTDFMHLTNSTSGDTLIVTNAGNVGVNSANPGVRLDVQGTVRTTSFTLTSVASGTQCLHANSSGVVTGTGSDCGSGGGGSSQWVTNGSSIGTTGGVVIGTTATGSSQLSVLNGISIGTVAGDSYIATVAPTGGIIMYGNMGVGTTAPIAQLDVENTVNQNNFLNVAGGNTGIGISTTSSTNKFDVLGNAALGSYGGVNAAPSNGLIVSGSVGIGTSSPQTALNVVGTLQVGATSAGWQITSSTITSGTTSNALVTNTIRSIDSGGLTISGRDGSSGTTGVVTVRGGNGNNGSTSAAAVVVQGGDGTVNSTENAGAATIRGGDITNSSATGAAGSLTVRPGGSSKTTGTNGVLIIAQTFQPGTFAAINDIACITGNGQAGDCGTSSTNPIGVAITTTAPAQIQTGGIATSVPFDGTYTPSAGWYVCTSASTGGQVTPQSTVCAANRQIGIITQGATSVTIGTFLIQKN